jgi:hypothetical protein
MLASFAEFRLDGMAGVPEGRAQCIPCCVQAAQKSWRSSSAIADDRSILVDELSKEDRKAEAANAAVSTVLHLIFVTCLCLGGAGRTFVKWFAQSGEKANDQEGSARQILQHSCPQVFSAYDQVRWKEGIESRA